jgi:hypothetical protein
MAARVGDGPASGIANLPAGERHAERDRLAASLKR